MELQEAKNKFVSTWSSLAPYWGINRTMAQLHATLMLSPEPLCTEDLMEQLSISRGNANMNVRALIDWGLVRREHKLGERKEYFAAKKDLWEITKQVAIQRKKRELDPLMNLLDEFHDLQGNPEDRNLKEFNSMTKKLKVFATKSDKSLDKIIYANEHWFFGFFMGLPK